MMRIYAVPYYRLAPRPQAGPAEDHTLVPVDHHVLLVQATDRTTAAATACHYFLGKGHVPRLEVACGFAAADVEQAGLPQLVRAPGTAYMPGDLVIEPAEPINPPPLRDSGEIIEPPKRKR